MRSKKKKDGYLMKSEVQLLIQNYIRNIQMNDYGSDSGIPQLYAVMEQIDNLPTVDIKQSEVTMKIFEEIDNIIYNLRDSPFYSSSAAVYELTELKKKYMEE